ELQLCTSTGKLEKQIAEVHELLTNQQKGHDLATVLERLAQLQTQIAEHEAQLAEQSSDKDLAKIHHGLADLQKELAQVQRDRDGKAREIETLRGRVAQLEQAQKAASAFRTTGISSFSQPSGSGNLVTGSRAAALLAGRSSLPALPTEKMNSAPL